MFMMVVLRKPGKPRYDIPKAYQPIALLNTIWKVLMAIVADQLTFITEKHQLLPVNHFGGRPGCMTTDTMHLLANTIKAFWRVGKVTSALFLDIEGTFPNAVPSCLEHNLRKCQVPSKIIKFICKMLHGRVTTLKFNGYMSEPINIDNGIGQGNPLSMGMYQYYNTDLIDILSEPEESAMAYVDDSIMIAIVKSFPEAHKKLLSMMMRAGGVINWSTLHNSPLEYSKLALVDFAHGQSTKRRSLLHLPQIIIQPTKSTRDLGVVFDQNLNWKEQHAYMIEKGTKWAMQIRRLARPTWGLTPGNARWLYISVAIPRILYVIDVWCVPPYTNGKCQRGTVKVIRKIMTIQRAGALAITGSLCTSATDALNAVAYLLPALLLADKACHRVALHLTMLPKEHPLHRIANNKTTVKIKCHKSPISSLLAAYKVDPKKTEKIPIAARDPMLQGELPFETSIAECREESVKEAKHTDEEVQVFMDGSALNSMVGAATILTREGNPLHMLHLTLGPEDEHTVYEAELAGILLGMHLISTESHGSTTFAMGVDNQVVISAFHSTLRNLAHHLAREILKVANRVQKRRRRGKYKLTIRWTARHKGIQGNEDTDHEAKRAVEGKTSDKQTLPLYLRKPLLTNPTAVKRGFHEDLKKKWKSEWEASVRGQRAAHIDTTTPSKKFLKTVSQTKLSCIDTSRIAQFRLGNAPINQYLKCMKRVDSARCPACGDKEESPEHFMLHCLSYMHERWALT